MILAELFDTKVPFKVTRTDRRWIASQIIGSRKIIFVAQRNVNYQLEADRWDIDFFEMQDGEPVQTTTGSGNELEVGSMVKKAMADFLSFRHPKIFTFEAASETRVKIYKRICDRLVGGKYKSLMHNSLSGQRLVYTKI